MPKRITRSMTKKAKEAKIAKAISASFVASFANDATVPHIFTSAPKLLSIVVPSGEAMMPPMSPSPFKFSNPSITWAPKKKVTSVPRIAVPSPLLVPRVLEDIFEAMNSQESSSAKASPPGAPKKPRHGGLVTAGLTPLPSYYNV